MYVSEVAESWVRMSEAKEALLDLQGQSTTGLITKALVSSSLPGLQSLMKIDLGRTYILYTSMNYKRSISEDSLCFIWLQLNKTQATIIRSAWVIGRLSASYFVFCGAFHCYASIPLIACSALIE